MIIDAVGVVWPRCQGWPMCPRWPRCLRLVPSEASVPVVAPVPAVPVMVIDVVPAAPAVVPQLPVVLAARRDENEHLKARFNDREFHVMMHDMSVDTTCFRNTEPSEKAVSRFVASRRRMTKQEFVRESLACAEHWPKMFLRVKELEHKQSQELRRIKRLDHQKNKRAATAKAKAEARAKAK
jgi:hypothetical protein